MNNFKKLNHSESDQAWDKFYELFDFKPSINVFPAITTQLPQLKFDITDCYYSTFPMKKLEELAQRIFMDITFSGERLYALDWQHECYDFDPRENIDKSEIDEWIIPIFPNGDYFIFSTKNFKNVWFGHPWEKTITLIGNEITDSGQKMIKELKEIKLTVLNKR